MDLRHIPLNQLRVASVNMRHGRKTPDLADILPSVRARGILQPLLVRPVADEPEAFEVVAGRRRYFCAQTIADEGGEIVDVPCAVIEPGDDAEALEASLIENVARLDPDEMSRFETFLRLTKEGKSVAAIATTFGLSELAVKRVLALGGLLPKIRDAYRREEIDAETIRHLTLASKAQQKDWLALFSDPEQHAPMGRSLKHWLFGGQSIPTKAALFPLESYTGPIVADLFGEDSYFGDVDQFWRLQNEAIADRREAYLAAGWSGVVILGTGQRFQTWEHEKVGKKKGGRVYTAIGHDGTVEWFEGWLTQKEARKLDRQDEAEPSASKTEKPEVTQAMRNYIDLHRHAAVRAGLMNQPHLALRLMLAHAIAGSSLWQVKAEPQTARNEAIAKSLAGNKGEQAFAVRRAEMLGLLNLPEERAHVVGSGREADTCELLAQLLTLSGKQVMRLLAFVMAETLAAGGPVVEAVGDRIATDMTAVWQADDAFFDLLRDKAVINTMLAEVAGKEAANGNLAATASVQKGIIRDCLTGANGRTKVEGWLPRWLGFPASTYTERGGVAPVEAYEPLETDLAAE